MWMELLNCWFQPCHDVLLWTLPMLPQATWVTYAEQRDLHNSMFFLRILANRHHLAGSLLLVSNHLQVSGGKLVADEFYMWHDVKSFFHEMVQHEHFIPAQNSMFFIVLFSVWSTLTYRLTYIPITWIPMVRFHSLIFCNCATRRISWFELPWPFFKSFDWRLNAPWITGKFKQGFESSEVSGWDAVWQLADECFHMFLLIFILFF